MPTKNLFSLIFLSASYFLKLIACSRDECGLLSANMIEFVKYSKTSRALLSRDSLGIAG